MRVLRGRATDPAADRSVTTSMLADTAETGTPSLRVWTPHRQVAFGRRDTHEEGYDRARAAAQRRGFTPVERGVGGRAVAYSGSTVAFAHAIPIDDLRAGLGRRYENATQTVQEALATLGVDTERGEPADAFCPGTHSLQRDGKIAGIAQRVQQDAALVGGCVVVTDRDELADVLAAVYRELGVPFDPESMGSVAAAGGPADPDRVVRALERAFVDGREIDVREVSDVTP